MEIVIDASALIAVLVNEPSRAALIVQTSGADLIAPASVHWEIGNAFAAMLKRGRITLEQALAALDSYGSIPIRLLTVDLDESLRLAHRLGLYAYDAYLLRCALQYRAPLLTLDRALAQKARMVGVQTVEV